MDRSSSLLKFLGLGLGLFLLMQFVVPKITGSDDPRTQPLGRERPLLVDAQGKPKPRSPRDRCKIEADGIQCAAAPAEGEAKEELCLLEGERFKAELTTQGAALRRLELLGPKYTVDGKPGSAPMNMVTTPDHESRRPLFTALRQPGADSQVEHDLFEWKLASRSPKECVFTYEDSKVALRKVVRASARPFELDVELSVKNVGAERAAHRASIESSAFRYETEVEGGFGRQSPFLTQVECLTNGKLEEATPADFTPKDFSKPEFRNGWRVSNGNIDFAATSNFYFAQALVPVDGPSAALCERLIEERYNHVLYASKKDDKGAGSFYRSRLAWEKRELGPGEVVTYKVIHFMGPKERDVLDQAAGGGRRMSELIRLGTFAPIAKGLVWFLVKCQGVVGSWGLAIILLTLAVRTVLFPLQLKAIKSGGKMRLLKPELDEINQKYESDPQQKQLATLELWRKHDVNPLGGCLPMLVQMPVWFALYTALQTAAELYHVPFLWLRDLSAPDTIWLAGHEVPFILPVLLGVTSFVQQKIMPTSGMDPAQQKMMTYMMPAVFTAMMLFLPSGLGVYMFTNSLLGIVQQLASERYYATLTPTGGGGGGGIEVREKEARDGDESGQKRTALAKLGKENKRD
jgi:YidC/Oxa1 family membrane protein insertase